MTFQFPKISIVAQNALTAHAEDRLQATSSHAPRVAHYYDEKSDTYCVIGASLPQDLALSFDKLTAAGISDLLEADLIAVPPNTYEKLIYLQRLHDKIVSARFNGAFMAGSAMALNIAEWKETLLVYLRKLAEEKD